jgi:hypothetical protein
MSCPWNATPKICKLKVDLNNAHIDMLNLIISLLGHVTQVHIKRKIREHDGIITNAYEVDVEYYIIRSCDKTFIFCWPKDNDKFSMYLLPAICPQCLSCPLRTFKGHPKNL